MLRALRLRATAARSRTVPGRPPPSLRATNGWCAPASAPRVAPIPPIRRLNLTPIVSMGSSTPCGGGLSVRQWCENRVATFAPTRLGGGKMRTRLILFVAASIMFGGSAATRADEDQVARGKYLVTISGCNDCHTPGALLGKPDFSRALSGSEVGFAIPGLGVFAGPNL